jgi:hypothetical protein
MKTKISVILLAASMLLCTNLKAESNYLGIQTDKYAHFGIAYAGQTVLYGIAQKKMKLDKTDSLIISALGMFAGSVLWETFASKQIDKGDILAGTLGQAAAITTVLVFDF